MSRPWRILVAAGGVKVPLDDVRWLGNRATGQFGVALATAARRRHARVTLLLADDVPDPRAVRLPHPLPNRAAECLAGRLAEVRQIVGSGRTRLTVVRFATFDQYARKLERLLRQGGFDAAFLTAAVADYAPEAVAGKLRSDAEEIVLRLRRLPKLIDRCKEWAPRTYLAGFKLLAGASTEELVAAARAAQTRHRAELVVANEWHARRSGRHTLYLVRPAAPAEKLGPADEATLAEALIEQVRKWRGDDQ